MLRPWSAGHSLLGGPRCGMARMSPTAAAANVTFPDDLGLAFAAGLLSNGGLRRPLPAVGRRHPQAGSASPAPNLMALADSSTGGFVWRHDGPGVAGVSADELFRPPSPQVALPLLSASGPGAGETCVSTGIAAATVTPRPLVSGAYDGEESDPELAAELANLYALDQRVRPSAAPRRALFQ